LHIDVDETDPRALADELADDGFADAGSAAGHQYGPVLEAWIDGALHWYPLDLADERHRMRHCDSNKEPQLPMFTRSSPSGFGPRPAASAAPCHRRLSPTRLDAHGSPST